MPTTIYQHTKSRQFKHRRHTSHMATQNFETGLQKLGRVIVVSERMAYFEKNELRSPQRSVIYLNEFKSLLEHFQLRATKEKMVNPTLVKKNDQQIFKELKPQLIVQPEFVGKYVAIIKGKMEGVGENKNQLAKEMYQKFGNVEMFVGNVSLKTHVGTIDTPERR